MIDPGNGMMLAHLKREEDLSALSLDYSTLQVVRRDFSKTAATGNIDFAPSTQVHSSNEKILSSNDKLLLTEARSRVGSGAIEDIKSEK